MLLTLPYLWMAAGTEQHGHVSEHANNSKRNRGDTLCVEHVRIVPATGVTEYMACLSPVTMSVRQAMHK